MNTMPQHPEALRAAAERARARGEHAVARDRFAAAAGLLAHALPPDPAALARCLRDEAEQSAMLHDHAAAQDRYREALALQRGVKPPDPDLVRTLVGLGWTLRSAGAPEAAAAHHREALELQRAAFGARHPSLAIIHAALGNALMAGAQHEAAAENYRQVLEVQRAAVQPDVAAIVTTLNILGELAFEVGDLDTGRAHQEDALLTLRGPDAAASGGTAATLLAPTLTNLGVTLLALDHDEEARACLEEALALAPELRLSATNLITAYVRLGRREDAAELSERTYRQCSFVVAPAPHETEGAVLVLSALDGLLPSRHLLSRRRLRKVTWFVEYATEAHEAALPDYQVAFNIVGDPDNGEAALAHAALFRGRCRTRLLNDPDHVLRTRRDRIPALLQGIDGLVMPAIVRMDAVALRAPTRDAMLARAGIAVPLLLRQSGRHGGDTVRLIESAEALQDACVSAAQGDAYYISAYHDYRSSDGFFRKYRMIFVDRRPFPYHLAISPHWLVHYFSADMLDHPAKRDEEFCYLEAPAEVLGPRALAVLTAIGQRLDLDYCGADFSLLPDGRVLLFEANATMLVHPETEPVLERKNIHVNRILNAFDTLLEPCSD